MNKERQAKINKLLIDLVLPIRPALYEMGFSVQCENIEFSQNDLGDGEKEPPQGATARVAFEIVWVTGFSQIRQGLVGGLVFNDDYAIAQAVYDVVIREYHSRMRKIMALYNDKHIED